LKLSGKYDLSKNEAGFTFLLPYLVHGVTAGIGVLASDDSYWKAYPIVYSALDISLTYFVYKSLAKRSAGGPAGDGTGLKFLLNPAPLFAANPVLRAAPIAGVSYRF
jgi:hypothetical protein